MKIYFYTIVIITQIVLVTLLFIYSKLNSNKRIKDFYITNFIYALAPILFILNEITNNESYKNILFKLSLGITISTYFFLTAFIYELLTKRDIKNKYRYLLLIFGLIISFTVTDLFLFNINKDVYINIEELLYLSFFIIVVIILIIRFNKIESSLQSKIIKAFMLIVLSSTVEEFFDWAFTLPDYNETFLSYNLFFIVYIFLKIIKEIDELKNFKLDDSKPNNLNFVEEQFDKFGVTEREREIVYLIMQGKANQEIADELFISINTVKIHIYNVYRKFKVNKRAELINLLSR